MSDKTEAELDTEFEDFEGDHFKVTITVDVIAGNRTEAAMLAYWSLSDELPDTFAVTDEAGSPRRSP